ncbi:MAG: GNAT family N-acetyltransferase [Chloroflexota bacterium]|nr:GNAT family N-acetyltransferase [Chloroflexota bacterium]MDE2918761.1 GNAT family N-acetyltransferase [Chloroflexota bacterium]
MADELDGLAGEEPPVADFRQAPVYAEQYRSLLEGRVDSGPSFVFPEGMARPAGISVIQDVDVLSRHFSGWTESEIPECAPIVGVVEDGFAVSVCFSARRSDEAAEAGVETAVDWRGRGLAPRVTAAWALAVRGSGRIPLYSTSWSNGASLSVARKLGLVGFGCVWSVWAP